MFFVGGAGSCLKRLLFRCPTIGQLVLVRTVDDQPATLVAAVDAVRSAHRRGSSARLATAVDAGAALEVGGDPVMFRWAGHVIDTHEDAVAVALSLPR